MELKTLLDVLDEKKVDGGVDGVEIQGIVYDPLRVEPGFLYVAIDIFRLLE